MMQLINLLNLEQEIRSENMMNRKEGMIMVTLDLKHLW